MESDDARDFFLKEIWPGAGGAKPFTIAIAANPFLEAPLGSGVFLQDPIMQDQAAFDRAVDYIARCLEGSVPGMRERLLGPADIRQKVRIVSLFAPGLSPAHENALVALRPDGFILEARRRRHAPFLAARGVAVDVSFAISESETHTRASAWYASDDDAGPGDAFDLDGVRLFHRHYVRIPGTIAIHSEERSLTPLHEFQHALSSYDNGGVTDLYVDSEPDVNNRVRSRPSDPIPSDFRSYAGSVYSSDLTRDGLGYPSTWCSYHCELHDPARPAVMDDYFQAREPLACQNDRITRAFLQDRLRAKINR